MAFELHRSAFPGIAASAVLPGQIVGLAAGSDGRAVAPCASTNEQPLGVALATAAVGEAVTVHDLGNVVKVTAGASMGVGAAVGVAVAASAPNVALVAGASGSVTWTVGRAVTAGGADETVSIFVHPRQLGGLA